MNIYIYIAIVAPVKLCISGLSPFTCLASINSPARQLTLSCVDADSKYHGGIELTPSGI